MTEAPQDSSTGAGRRSPRPLDVQAIDAVIERGVELLDSAIRAGEVIIDRERWAIPAKYADRIDERQFALVLLGLAVKSARSLQALRSLVREDLGSDAMAIARTMVEGYATVLELTGEHWADRFERYRTFLAKQELAHVNDLRSNPHAKDTEGPGTESIESFLREAKDFFGEEELKRIQGKWIPDGVQGALRRRGLQSLYDSVYRVGSKAVHAVDPGDFVEWSEADGFTVLTGSRWSVPALAMAPCVFLDVLVLVSNVLGLGVAGEANKLQAELFAATGFVPPGAREA
jgi:hypothetical protein